MILRALRRSPWAIPALLGISSLAALLVALTSDGLWDVLAWMALAVPQIVVAWAATPRVRRNSPPAP